MKDIKNCILEKLSNTYLFEMADSRQDYLAEIMAIRYQILDNWCLIKYCNLYDEENYNRLHWCSELYAHLDRLWRVSLKRGLNKLKTTEYGFIDKAEFDDVDEIVVLLKRKWKVEKLPIDKLEYIAEEFTKALPRICKMVSDRHGEDIYDYVYNEI